MDKKYKVAYVDKPEESAWGIIGRGAKKAYLDTFSFQSPDFYKQHGYQVFGELQDFPPGNQRYFFTRRL